MQATNRSEALWNWLLASMLFVLSAAACTSSDAETDSGLASSAVSSSTSTSSTTSTTAAPETEPEPSPDETQALIDVWHEFLTIGANRSDPARVAELSTTDGAAQADAELFDSRDIQSFYSQVTIDGERATIEDCPFFSRPLSMFWFIPTNGEAILEDGEWKISSLQVNEREKCIAGDIAAEVLEAYEAYWDGKSSYSDPPDPDNPRIEQTLTGRQLERLQEEILPWQVANEAAWRGRPRTTPEISDFRPGVFTIDDCQVADQMRGYYDIASGLRREDSEPIEPGQTDALRTRLEFEDKVWKVEFVGADRNIDCDFAPTEAGIPIVGPLRVNP